MFNFIKNKFSFWKNNYVVSDEDKNTIFEHTETKIWLWANYAIIFLIVLSVIIVWLYTIPWFGDKYLLEIFLVDFFISSVFLIEYLYRWKYSWHKKQFPFRLLNVLDLLSFLPFFILIIMYGTWSYAFFALFRIFRVFRIFELVVRIPIISKIWKWINKHKIEYLSAIFIILMALVIFSTLVYLFEQNWWDIVSFSSIPQTFWWAIVTMTTTWYWDMIPHSTWWKIIASFLMILWPILITMLSTITVIIFIESTKIISFWEKTLKCEKCDSENDWNAKFCKKCGTNL